MLGTVPEVEPDDVVATLTMLSARTVGSQLVDAGVHEVVASGGGTKNPVLMEMLRSEYPRHNDREQSTSSDFRQVGKRRMSLRCSAG